MIGETVALRAVHDQPLVLLSILISILAAYAARDLAERLGEARGRAWLAWLAGGAVVDGIGTWSMHYTGKLALRLPVPILFDGPTVVLSLSVGILGSALALAVMSSGAPGWSRAVIASLFLGGLGISGLHFTAMAAMRLPGMHHRYDSAPLIVLSIVEAVAICLLALTVSFRPRSVRASSRWRYHSGAILRGSANPAMHYTAMAAVLFVFTNERPDRFHAVSIQSLGILGISIVPVMVLVIALVITLVDRLQKRKALLDELFEQAPQAVALLSADDRLIRVNREFTRVFGYSPDETLGHRLSALIVPEDLREEAQRYVHAAARGQRVDVETIRLRKDGSRFHVSLVRVPVSMPGGQVGIYAIYSDITERKQAEEELRRSEALLAEAQQLAHIGSWNWDLVHDTFLWSDEHYRIFGFNPQDPPITPARAWGRVHPDDRPAVQDLVARAIRERRPYECNLRLMLDDGSVRIVQSRGRVVTDEAGNPVRMFGTIQDVTERDRAEQAVRESADRLQSLSRRLLEVQEAERRHLARELHDEVGQLLTGLRLLLKTDDGSNPEAMRTRSEQARGIVDELLERVRELSFDLRPAALDQLGLVPALLALFERLTDQTGLEINFKHQGVERRLAPEMETTCYRIVQEALTNVARHAGVTNATVRVWATSDLLSVQIEDRGHGFNPEAALASSRTSGLAGMQERVMLLGGSLTVESRPGAGTQITAELSLRTKEGA